MVQNFNRRAYISQKIIYYECLEVKSCIILDIKAKSNKQNLF